MYRYKESCMYLSPLSSARNVIAIVSSFFSFPLVCVQLHISSIAVLLWRRLIARPRRLHLSRPIFVHYFVHYFSGAAVDFRDYCNWNPRNDYSPSCIRQWPSRRGSINPARRRRSQAEPGRRNPFELRHGGKVHCGLTHVYNAVCYTINTRVLNYGDTTSENRVRVRNHLERLHNPMPSLSSIRLPLGRSLRRGRSMADHRLCS
ncbi:hypothetical protein F5888DRAFT_433211 [Russula emetica]|nr:hypothetical protein F5888DRAFT_433211 [Russula emetica]